MKNRMVLKALSAWLALSFFCLSPVLAIDVPPNKDRSVSEFVSSSGDFYVYQRDRLKFIVLSDGRMMKDLILSADKASIVDFTLLDAGGNLISESGILTHPDLARTPLARQG